MRRGLLIAAGMVLAVLAAKAQEPITWSYSAKPLGQGVFEVHLKAELAEGWHVYSQHQPGNSIASPTAISYLQQPLLSLVGITQEVGDRVKYENEMLGVVQFQFDHEVDFVQRIKLKGNVQIRTNVTGTIHYQVCTDEQCLQPTDIHFNIPLPVGDVAGK